MVEHLVILASAAAADDARARLGALGGRVVAAYGPLVWVVDSPAEGAQALASEPGVQAVFDGPAPDGLAGHDEAGRMGIAAWNLRQSPEFRASRQARIGEGRSWDDEGVEPEG
jgi:hypothetical protein